jgi:hypothetical protein
VASAEGVQMEEQNHGFGGLHTVNNGLFGFLTFYFLLDLVHHVIEVGSFFFMPDTRTTAQTEQIQLLFMRLHKLFPAAHICGHRDLPGTTPKACPCLDTAAVFGFIE